MAAYAVGTRAPGLIFGISTTGTLGGRMLEILIKLMFPMPAARSALSKALRAVPPSACPVVAAAKLPVLVIRWLLPSSVVTCLPTAGRRRGRFPSGHGRGP